MKNFYKLTKSRWAGAKGTTQTCFSKQIILSATLLLLLQGVVLGQTMLYSENFGTETAIPVGWTLGGWTISTATSSTTPFTGGSNAASSGNNDPRTITYSNNLSTVGYTNITISWAARRVYANSVTCQWSINGTTWNNLTFTDVTNNSTWALVNGGTRIVLPVGAENAANLRIRWTYDSDGTAGRYRIEDFSVQGMSFIPPYCIPTYTTGTLEGDYIARVQLGDINNVTVGSASPYYTYYSSLSTDLTLSNSYTITLRSGTYQSANNISVWIDYNQNGTFETSEKLGNVTLLANSNGTINFTVPSGAILGITRMRVRETWNESNMDPCTGYIYGETEDYNINITSACTPPAGLSYTTASPSYCNGIAIITNNATLTTTGIPAPIFSVSPALPDGLSLNTSTGAITGTPTVNVAATDYTVTAFNTCGSASSVVNIAVNPAPTMNSADIKNICSGEVVALNLTSDIASTYSWIATDNANVTGESITSQSSATISDVLVNTTTSVQTVTYIVTPTSTTGNCSGTIQTVTVIISAPPSAPTTTGSQICIGTTATLSASGATSGQVYKWYNAVSGGTLLKTSTSNTDNTFTTPVLSVTKNYWVTIQNSTGCESARTQVTATFPAVSTDSQTTSGNNSWIGHVYDGTNFTTYYGTYTESESFLQVFGGNTFCFGINSSLGNRSVYTETYSVRYRMTTSLSGCYLVNLRADDGIRLFVDGVKIFDRWTDQAPRDYNNVLLPLNNNSQLVYEFYENGGQNEVAFRNLYKIDNNVLTGGTDQTICAGNSATQISAANLTANNVALPAGLTTTWQWYYSNSPTTSGTIITGAVSQNYTPTGYPFNSPGIYYVYRVATVSSSNATNGNNWGATSPVSCSFESDRATITVNPLPATPTISSNTPICAEENAVFSLSGTSGAIVNYNINGGSDTTVTLTGGTATVTITAATANQTLNLVSVTEGSCTRILTGNSSTITVNPLPVIGSFN